MWIEPDLGDWSKVNDKMRNGQIVMLAVVGLLSLGVLMVHSAGMSVEGGAAVSQMLTSRHFLHALTAVLAMLIASRLDAQKLLMRRGWTNPLPWAMLIAMGMVVAAMIPGVGLTINGARRWLSLGPRSWGLTFQPSEMVKWLMVAAIAAWCARRQGMMHRFVQGILPPLILVGFACGVIVIEDLGTAMLIGVVSVGLLAAGGGRVWQLGTLSPVAAGAVLAAIMHSPYRLRRLTSFMHPWEDPQGAGYQALQSLAAIAQGGILGRGLGNGIQKYGYLPADTSDFLYAIICEELGLPGAALVVVAFLMILWAGLAIVRNRNDVVGRLLGLGILLTVGLQAMVNLGVVTVVLPTKGIALPLLSAGGTGWIMTAAAMGVLVSLDRPTEEGQMLEIHPAVGVAPA
ncbi:MAG: cell division protein FtsW [Phycisphaeraceae bacterium]|nr:cell division protein FtsW [Phycisphaeraceae bacterium]